MNRRSTNGIGMGLLVAVMTLGGCYSTPAPKSPHALVREAEQTGCADEMDQFLRADEPRERNFVYGDAPDACQELMLAHWEQWLQLRGHERIADASVPQ